MTPAFFHLIQQQFGQVMFKAILGFEGQQDCPIWRYVDFTKFVSLLHDKSLYFTRIDKFDDPFEGSFPRINLKPSEDWLKQLAADYAPFSPKLANVGRHIRSFVKDLRKTIYANCWHENVGESAAMWRLYLKSDEGIAIQSTIGRLQTAFDNAPKSIHVGKIKYIEYDKDEIPETNLLAAFLHKRKSFEHEREVRALIWDFETHRAFWDPITNSWSPSANFASSLRIPVSLPDLIEKVYVSPTSAPWFYDLVRSVLDKYGVNVHTIHSNLNSDPVW